MLAAAASTAGTTGLEAWLREKANPVYGLTDFVGPPFTAIALTNPSFQPALVSCFYPDHRPGMYSVLAIAQLGMPTVVVVTGLTHCGRRCLPAPICCPLVGTTVHGRLCSMRVWWGFREIARCVRAPPVCRSSCHPSLPEITSQSFQSTCVRYSGQCVWVLRGWSRLVHFCTRTFRVKHSLGSSLTPV